MQVLVKMRANSGRVGGGHLVSAGGMCIIEDTLCAGNCPVGCLAYCGLPKTFEDNVTWGWEAHKASMSGIRKWGAQS